MQRRIRLAENVAGLEPTQCEIQEYLPSFKNRHKSSRLLPLSVGMGANQVEKSNNNVEYLEHSVNIE